MKTLIVGGVAGGATVAARLRRMDEQAEIILLERGQYVSYANCGLPYYIGGTIKERNKLFVQTVQGFVSRFNIDIRVNSDVTAIDAANKTVTVRSLATGETYKESYDKLVLSPGAEPMRPPIKGIDGKRIFALRNVPDTDRIKSYLTEQAPKRALVVGGGFIGLEMAENLHAAGMQVCVVEMAAQVMAPLDFSMAAIVHRHLKDQQVGLLLNEGVVGFEDMGNTVLVSLRSGMVMETDMVIWSIGVRPETQLAKQAGLVIGSLGGIKVNEFMQTSDPDIYALGDAVEVLNLVTGKPTLIPLAGPANKQGRLVADNIALGNSHSYKGSMGTAIAKVFDLTVATVGVPAKVLARDGIAHRSSYTHSLSHAGYYPGSLPLSIKICFSPADGRLLGAQVVGFQGVDKRVEMFAQVIQRRGTVYDLCELEHAYAPPYSSAKDPVNMAGFVADNILSGRVQTIHWRDVKSLDRSQNVLVDVRTKEEHELGHIEGDILLPVDSLRSRLSELPRDKNVVVYCAVGLRGYLASRILLQHGFTRVQNLSGGYKTYSVADGDQGNLPTGSGLADGLAAKGTPADDAVPTMEVDACGLQCPGPILLLKKHYDSLGDHHRLVIRATDQAFGKDAKAWCHVMGAKLISVENKKGVVEVSVEKGEKPAVCSISAKDNKTMVVFSDDLDKALATFVIANGAAAMGKKVTMFFTFWGLNVIKKQQKPTVKKDFFGKMFGWMMPSSSKHLALSKMNMGGMGSRMMRMVMQRKQVDSLESLIQSAIENNIEMIACTMSMDVMGVKQEELLDHVSLAGVATYLERTEEANMNLFI